MTNSNNCVFVFAPAGAGKSRSADVLAAMFGCTTIVDEWDGSSPVPDGALVLCQGTPPASVQAKKPVPFPKATMAVDVGNGATTVTFGGLCSPEDFKSVAKAAAEVLISAIGRTAASPRQLP